jgi:hypothetical protein
MNVADCVIGFWFDIEGFHVCAPVFCYITFYIIQSDDRKLSDAVSFFNLGYTIRTWR